MQILQQLKATNELDLIYAFIGFEDPKAPPGIKVKYELPVRTVWVNAARNIIQKTGSLNIFATARGDEKSHVNLPSWVPDFSRCYPYARPITAPDFKTAFEASGVLPHVWEGPLDSEVLVVKGKVISTIMWLSPLNPNFKFHRLDPKGTKTMLDSLERITYCGPESCWDVEQEPAHFRNVSGSRDSQKYELESCRGIE